MPILTPEERLGSTVANRYVLRSVLGRGGMGVVFRAEHTLTGRPVALKTMSSEMVGDPTIVQRFVREARAAGRLIHPNIVEVLDVGVAEDGTPFMVLELLEGEPLSAHLERKGVLSTGRVLSLLLPILDALALAHAGGVIHRDLKPDNVFLARVGDEVTPKLLDFGIAKVADDAASLRTRTGAVMGTPAYMSPEQARGMTDIGPAADQWSIGVMLFEALSGELPYTGETFPVLLGRILTTDAPSLASRAPSVPPQIAAVVDRVLSRLPEARYPDVYALGEALRVAGDGAGIALMGAGSPRVGGVSAFPPAKIATGAQQKSTDLATMEAAPLPARTEHAPIAPVSAAPASIEAPPPAIAREAQRTSRGRWALPVVIAVALGLGGVGAIVWATQDASTSRDRSTTQAEDSVATTPMDAPPPTVTPHERDDPAVSQRASSMERTLTTTSSSPAASSSSMSTSTTITPPEPMDDRERTAVQPGVVAPRRGSMRPRPRPTPPASTPPPSVTSPPPTRDPMELRGW